MSYAMMVLENPMSLKKKTDETPKNEPKLTHTRLGEMKLTHGAVQPLLGSPINTRPLPSGQAHGAAWLAARKQIKPF